MWNYPVTLTPDDNGTLLVSFADVPEAITHGEDRQEALMRARDALETALEMYLEAKQPLPLPSPAGGGATVTPSAQARAKLEVYLAMRQQQVGKAELACRLGWHLPQVDRLLDLRHATRLDAVEAALAALGKHLVVEAVG